MILNSIFKDKVVVNSDECFNGCKFISGTTAKEKGVHGLTINGSAHVDVQNCEFANKGYSAIYMNSTGIINIENNKFDCTGVYNPIEGGSSASNAKLVEVNIKGNVFDGQCGNNYINFYHMEDGAIVNIEDNLVDNASSESEILRLSNLSSAEAVFNVKNNNYRFADSNETDYTAFIMCQDYTAKSGKPQDFSKYVVNIEGLKCNNAKVEEKPVQGKLFFVYQDGAGIIETNDPQIILR